MNNVVVPIGSRKPSIQQQKPDGDHLLQEPAQFRQEALSDRQRMEESYVGGEFLRSLSAYVRDEVRRVQRRGTGYIKLHTLPNRALTVPLDVAVEPDDGGYIARSFDLPLYGYGDDPVEAVDALKCEIESLIDDLLENDDLTPEFVRIKSFLIHAIADK